MKIEVLKNKFCIAQLRKEDQIPDEIEKSSFYSITKTNEEVSVVFEQKYLSDKIKAEKDWRALKIVGPLEFSQVGIIANISRILAKAKISIFTISTFNTDYFFIKEKYFNKAINILRENNYN